MPKHPYGLKADLRDQNDYFYAAPYDVLQALPASIDLRPGFPDPPYDQGQLGSCVSNASAGFAQYLLAKEQKLVFMPSRLFIYYNGRLAEGTVNSDSGESVRDGVRTLNKLGVPPETDWPYNIADFTVEPPQQAYTDALLTKALLYQRVMQNLSQMLGCLASGYPMLIGFSVYQSMETSQVDQTGIVPLPSPGEQLLGGHCVLLVGYDTTKQLFTFRNSWSTSWGDKGYGYIPFAYLANPQLASDFWTIRFVS